MITVNWPTYLAMSLTNSIVASLQLLFVVTITYVVKDKSMPLWWDYLVKFVILKTYLDPKASALAVLRDCVRRGGGVARRPLWVWLFPLRGGGKGDEF